MPKQWKFAACVFAVGIAGCVPLQHALIPEDGPPTEYIDVSSIADAIPKDEAKSKYGNPENYVVFGKNYHVMDSSSGYKERGIASWYGTKFHDKLTSSGEPYDMYAMTAAHKTLPIPCYVHVTNLENGKQITVKVNDRGPFHENRIIDLSYVAAKKLGITAKGTGLVEVDIIETSHTQKPIVTVAKSKPSLYLQLGAFSFKDNASRLTKHIQAITPVPVSLETTSLNDVKLYRVRIGPLATVDKSDALFKQLAQAGLGNTYTVIE